MGPLGGLGITEIILIFVVILLLFGAKRIPEIGSALGKGIREFKGSIREIEGEIKGDESRRSTPPSSQPREVPAPRQQEGGEAGAGSQGGRADPTGDAPSGGGGPPSSETPGAPSAEPARPGAGEPDAGADGSDEGAGESDDGERRTLTTSD